MHEQTQQRAGPVASSREPRITISRERDERLLLTSLRVQEASEVAKQERARLRALLETLNEGVVIIDGDGAVVMLNQAARRIIVEAPAPASVDELCLAHDPAFARGVLAGERMNGFGNKRSEVAAALPFTTGAMLSAARWVIARGGVAAAPCSGFHHAAWVRAGGFCTFNGLMVTALTLAKEGRARRVGILDFDRGPHHLEPTHARWVARIRHTVVTHAIRAASYTGRSRGRRRCAAAAATASWRAIELRAHALS